MCFSHVLQKVLHSASFKTMEDEPNSGNYPSRWKWFCRTFPSPARVARRRTTIGASHLHNPGGWLEGRWRGFPPQLLFLASRSEAVGLAPSSGDGGSPPSMGCLATCLLLGGRDPSRLMLGGGGAVTGRLLAAAC
jgi:hypothetical protein